MLRITVQSVTAPLAMQAFIPCESEWEHKP